MTFEQAVAELRNKLPAKLEWCLVREAGFESPEGDGCGAGPFDGFELRMRGDRSLAPRVFRVRDGRLDEAVAAAVDHVRNAELAAGEGPKCIYCHDTGYVVRRGGNSLCPHCDAGIPF
jgi:hypothetical protein